MTTTMDDPRSTSKNGGDALLLSSQTKYKHASLFVFRRRRRRRIAGISSRSDSQQLLEKQRRMGSMTATVSSAAAPATASVSSSIITTGLLGTAVGAKQPRKFPRDWLQKLVHGAAVDNNDTTNNNNSNNMPRRPIYVVAPMVDQSDLPFRLQCRKYGAHLCFTPMIHAKLFATQKKYRQKFSIRTDIANLDRPLIAQLCGSDVTHVIETALAIQNDVDGIDINCGCPQQIAKRGHYGAFLLEDPIHLVSLVQELSTRLSIPVSVKVRLLPTQSNNAEPDVVRSLALYRQLIDAGASMLSIHARTRYQKGHDTGQADWDAIRIAVQEFGNVVPILANGNIGTADDVLECLQYTGADGVMSSEAILEYPPLFWPLVADTTTDATATTMTTTTTTTTRPVIPSVTLSLEYLDYAERYPPDQQGQGNGFKTVRNHLHRFLHGALQQHTNVRDVLVRAKTLDELRACIIQLRDVHQYVSFAPVWYNRHRQQQQSVDDNCNNTCGKNKGSETTASITTATTMAAVQKSKNEDAATTNTSNTTMTAETEETSLGAEEENPGNNMAADNVDDMDGTDAGMEEEKEDSTTKRQKVE
jgi:tRNA-dihydrouridine synthase 1